MPAHASPRPRRRPRPWVAALVGLAALAPAIAVGAIADPFDGPATVGQPAVRMWSSTSGGLMFPIEPVPMCEFLNNFGGHSKTYGSGNHEGVDIGASEGQDVYAVEDGTVTVVDLTDDAGESVGLGVRMISDSEVQYRYYHLSAVAGGLVVGQRVSAGQIIGYVGDTGNATPGGYHLHFEVRPNAESTSRPYDTPVDPAPLLAIPSVCNVYGSIDYPDVPSE